METWEKIGQFFGRHAILGVYIFLLAKYTNLHAAYYVFLAFGIFFGSIAADFMEDHNGTARVVIFIISFTCFIIPALIQNILLIINPSPYFFEQTYFIFCALWIFVIWLTCGYTDVANLEAEIIALFAAIFYSVIVFVACDNNPYSESISPTSAILFLVGGGIILIVMFIMRLVNGSAFESN